MRIPLAISALILAGCSAPAPQANVEGTVAAAVAATVQAIPKQPTPTAAAVGDQARGRSGAALSVWATAPEAYLAQYQGLTPGAPRCTIPPYTDVSVISRDAGFRFSMLSANDQRTVTIDTLLTGLAPDIVAQVASTDRRCSGYIARSLLTD